MDEKKEPLSLNEKQNLLVCPECNFPIRSEDKKCMFCNTTFQPTGWRVYYYFFRRYYQQLQWRRRLKKRKSGRGKQQSAESVSHLKYFAYSGLGIVLTLIGGYLFFVAMMSNSFSNCIMSLLFLFYGIYTLKTLLYKK